MKKLLFIGSIFLFTLTCTSPEKKGNPEDDLSLLGNGGAMQYAEKFSKLNIGDFTLLEVYSPWQNAEEIKLQYLLGKDSSSRPDSLTDVPFIKVPVQKAVVLSTTYIAFLDTLGVGDVINGVSGCNWVYANEYRRKIDQGKIREVGYDENLNYEVIVDLQPDVVFMYGIRPDILSSAGKLRDAGIDVVLCADYLEPKPLGRAEWLKFFSSFFSLDKKADEIFKGIEKKYENLRDSVNNLTGFPSVMMGLPWKDSWYIAGGESFAARLIEDAGANYMYAHLDNSEAKAMSIESVFMQCLDADFWINPGVASSMEKLLQHDERFKDLKSFKEGDIFSNTKRMSSSGGNDYWESGVINPQKILNDLVQIFHGPDSLDKDLFYYYRLQ